MGRKRIEINMNQVTELAGLGLYHWQIAQALGISEDTLRRRLKDDARLESSLRQTRLRVITDLSRSVLEKARAGNLQAQLFILRSFSKRFREFEVSQWDELAATIVVTQDDRNQPPAFQEAPSADESDDSPREKFLEWAAKAAKQASEYDAEGFPL